MGVMDEVVTAVMEAVSAAGVRCGRPYVDHVMLWKDGVGVDVCGNLAFSVGEDGPVVTVTDHVFADRNVRFPVDDPGFLDLVTAAAVEVVNSDRWQYDVIGGRR